MSLVGTGYEHIVLDDDNKPLIAGTTMKVVELVAERRAYGWSPEELHFQHPHLTLGQIFSALAYYWDHVEELDQDLERRLEHADKQRQAAGRSPLKDKLESQSQ
jgi:uncharacterized protein (DUF433 family)